ncbi:SDR family oxidoreductase [Roseomonas sp. NAR14]|uniref:SDR family oxidoreductase n=1 Tax=Roseomonas acroporae TaxID=2937791 RepID=A0A9X1YAM0_9PROT|nr:SDR family oxidoreductase [Roseomonas acroporae]MCK8786190.1 SDR family oxidoreductase [Roseomonas acroporae]
MSDPTAPAPAVSPPPPAPAASPGPVSSGPVSSGPVPSGPASAAAAATVPATLPAEATNAVLILGAASDIGAAIARAHAAEGRPLILLARQPARLEREAADLRLRHGVAVQLLPLDVLDLAAHAPLLDSLPVLPATVISVVGLLGEQPRSAADPAEAERVMRTNYLAPALFLGEVANRMEARGSGTIIGISSVAGDRGRASNYVYGSAKAGFTAFLSGLRNRLAGKGVHVVTVKPGFVDTQMTAGMNLPKPLTAQPEEVAKAVLAAEARGRDVIYVRPVWRVIMSIIRGIPEPVFKRRNL